MDVLIGTDGSDDAIAAARHALTLLATPDRVTVVYVTEPPATATAGFESGFAGGVAKPDVLEADWKLVEEEAHAALARTAEELTTAGTVEQLMEVGSAGPELCRLAAHRGADIIVVGSRGRGAIRRALLGSVSAHVVNNAPCPVIVVRAGTDT